MKTNIPHPVIPGYRQPTPLALDGQPTPLALGGDIFQTDPITEAVREERLRIFKRRWKVVAEAKGDSCFLRLVGKRCGTRLKSMNYTCPCKDKTHFDHPSLWVAKDGTPRLFVAQPYIVTGRNMRHYLALCDEHDLAVIIRAKESFHLHGDSMLVILMRKDTARRLQLPGHEWW